MKVSYERDGRSFEVKYDEYFMLNGELVDTEYARYENEYVNGRIERGADTIEFFFGGQTLVLNFKEGTREE